MDRRLIYLVVLASAAIGFLMVALIRVAYKFGVIDTADLFMRSFEPGVFVKADTEKEKQE